MNLRRTMLATVAVIGLTGTSAFAQSPAPDVFNTAQKQEIEKIILNYLYQHPEIIDLLEKRLVEKKVEEALAGGKGVAQQAPALQAPNVLPDGFDKSSLLTGPAVGAEDAAVTVVEFFDYNCGYCKRAAEPVNALQERHTPENVRIIFKEFPILSEGSRIAARYALAAAELGNDQYRKVHDALMAAASIHDESSVKSALMKAGIDIRPIEEKLLDDEVTAFIEKQLQENYELAHKLGIGGTPSFVVGDQLVKGADIPALNKAVAALLPK
jgi:protein-disulfide isomerase